MPSNWWYGLHPNWGFMASAVCVFFGWLCALQLVAILRHSRVASSVMISLWLKALQTCYIKRSTIDCTPKLSNLSNPVLPGYNSGFNGDREKSEESMFHLGCDANGCRLFRIFSNSRPQIRMVSPLCWPILSRNTGGFMQFETHP